MYSVQVIFVPFFRISKLQAIEGLRMFTRGKKSFLYPFFISLFSKQMEMVSIADFFRNSVQPFVNILEWKFLRSRLN